MDNYNWRKEVDREMNYQHSKAQAGKEDKMGKYTVISGDDGFFVPQGPSGLYQLIPDEDLGRTLREMSNGAAPEKPKRKRGPNKRKALGKGLPATASASLLV